MTSNTNNTSNAGLFGQPLDGDLLFDQISGPKLFMPMPVATSDQSPQHFTPETNHSGNLLNTANQLHSQVKYPQQSTAPPNLHSNTKSSLNTNQNMEQNFHLQQGLNVSPVGTSQTIPHNSSQSFPTNMHQQQLQHSPHEVKPQLAAGQYQYQPYHQTHLMQEANKGYSQLHQPGSPQQSQPVLSHSQHIEPYAASGNKSNTSNTPPTPPNITPFSTQQQSPYPQRPTQVVQPIPKQAQTATSSAQMNFSSVSPPQPDSTQTLLQNKQQNPTAANISPNAEHLHDGTPLPVPPLLPHWFYVKDYKRWVPFSYLDSTRLETLFVTSMSGKVTSTDGGRYDVNLDTMTRSAVYWNESPSQVRRCTWFYKGGTDSKLVPYDTTVAELLEKSYVSMMKCGVFNVRVDITPSNFVIFHNPNVLVQYTSNPQQQGWTGEDSVKRPKVVRRAIPTELQEEIQLGECEEIDHLVLVVHGIGIYSDGYRSIVECVNDFRRISSNQIASHSFTCNGKPSNRVEYLPIQWHSCVHEERSVDRELNKLTLPSIGKMRNFVNDTLTDVLFFTSPVYCQAMCDKVVSEMNCTFKLFKSRNPSYTGSVSVIGHSLGSIILFDILAGQIDKGNDDCSRCEMYEDVGDEIDVSSRSLQRSPQTSLSSLTTQTSGALPPSGSLPPIEVLCEKLNLLSLLEMFKEEQIDTETIMMCSEADLRDLEIPFGPRKKLLSYIREQSCEKKVVQSSSLQQSSQINSSSTRGTQTPVQLNSSTSDDSAEFLFEKSNAGIGQPLIKCPKLEFQTSCLFCLGSPIGLFLTSRGIHHLGTDYKLPMCPEFMNIFHPYDPVAYRIEPLINENIDLAPSLVPHHKGRKRIHLEIKENLTRAGAQIKHSILDAVNRTWSSINDFAKAHRSADTEGTESTADGTQEIDSISDCTLDSLEEEAVSLKERSLDFGKLNSGGRVDFVLQENPIESLNEYIFALSSHLCYWTSDDTALLVIDKIYRKF